MVLHHDQYLLKLNNNNNKPLLSYKLGWELRDSLTNEKISELNIGSVCEKFPNEV